jgi:8-oxo-dGTP pyrophosphatase MutT (NUDIX family)
VRRQPIKDAVSAGGVVVRDGTAALEVVICESRGRHVWGLPKGTPEPGEQLVETAVREVGEETGLQVAIVQELGSIDYWFAQGGARVHKYVHFWLMRPTGGDIAEHDAEFDAVEWVAMDRAMETLTYESDREVVRRAAKLIDAV